MKTRLALVVMCTLACGDLIAGQLEDGDLAIREGRYGDAFELLMPEAKNGNAFAQYNVAYIYKNGLGVPENFEQAVYWYKQAAAQGDADAMTNLGLMIEKGQGTEQDFETARTLYLRAADTGHGLAQNNLGAMYISGRGVNVDYSEGIKWLTLAANQDIPQALNSLGVLYIEGRRDADGVDKNSELGSKLLVKAAALGDQQAKVNLFGYTRLQAENGDLQAMHNLGAYFLTGFGIEPDSEKGIDWLTRAATVGVTHSQQVLIQIYEQGAYGVRADQEKAAHWRGKVNKQ